VRVVWTRAAVSDLQAVRRVVEERDARAARNVAVRIRDATRLLAEHPAVGRPGRVAGTRELLVPRTPYILPYRVVGEVLEVLRVLHWERRWAKRL
jgi:addiction module RelE/StbE family toxin